MSYCIGGGPTVKRAGAGGRRRTIRPFQPVRPALKNPMARRSHLDERLAALHALREDPRAPGAEDLLRRSLAESSGIAVAAAAAIIGDTPLTALLPLLPAAFDRLVASGADHDKGCRGKLAIAAALLKNEMEAAPLFLTGIRLVQREPIWGGSVDTAASLRGTCALGLAMLDHREAMEEIAVLLADPESQARAHAAVALGNIGRTESIPLLRFKCLVGDDSPEVITECFSSLLSLRGDQALPFVASFLDGKSEATAESAALALGQSRRDAALPLLRDFADRARPALLRSALLALGLLRSAAATDALLAAVEKAPVPTATHALSALAIQRGDEALTARVRAVVEKRRLRALDQAFAEVFEG